MTENPHDPNPLNPPTPEMRRYWEALGRLVHEFAQTEKLVAVNLWRLTGISIRIAQAAFSGVRVDHATSLIARILEATDADQPVKDEFQYIFTQLGHITKARNDIVHYGTEFALGTEFKTSNRLVAYLDHKVRETPVSADTLDEMSDDLQTIQKLLARRLTTGWVPIEVQERMFGPYSRGTWRYKPPSQASRPRKPRDRPPKPKRQPGSSQA